MQTLTITRPDDWHLHLRDGPDLASVLPHTSRVFARAVVMPNLRPPITDTALAAAYRARILGALPKGSSFEPLMTLYLTDDTSVEEIARAARSGFVCGVKYYPAGATTNSASGVTRIYSGSGVTRIERVFLETVLVDVVRSFPGLRVVVEH